MELVVGLVLAFLVVLLYALYDRRQDRRRALAAEKPRPARGSFRVSTLDADAAKLNMSRKATLPQSSPRRSGEQAPPQSASRRSEEASQPYGSTDASMLPAYLMMTEAPGSDRDAARTDCDVPSSHRDSGSSWSSGDSGSSASCSSSYSSSDSGSSSSSYDSGSSSYTSD